MDNQYYNEDSILKGSNGFCTKILFDEANAAIKTERIKTNVVEFIAPENCAKIRVGFLNSNKQEAINGYKLEKTV